MLTRLLTRNLTRIPLFTIYLDYRKYKKYGKKNSCEAKIHPLFRSDDFVKDKIAEIVDYIRDNYDVDDIK